MLTQAFRFMKRSALLPIINMHHYYWYYGRCDAENVQRISSFASSPGYDGTSAERVRLSERIGKKREII